MKFGSQLYDICIVCALYEEAQAVLDEYTTRCGVSFHQAFSQMGHRLYYHTTLINAQQEPLTLLVTWLSESGPIQVSLDLKPLLYEFRPRFVAMTGICAGDSRRVNLGDIVVAQMAYSYEEGKIIKDADGVSHHLLDTKTAEPSSQILQYVRGFDSWKAPLKALVRPPSMQGEVSSEELRCVIAPMASGMAVRGDDPFPWLQARYHRNTLALDMEAATFYRAVHAFPQMQALVVKGVSDYADLQKNDAFHDYAARASALYVLAFIQTFVTEQTMPRQESISVPNSEEQPGESQLDVPFPLSLPLPLTSFVGRERDVEQVCALLERPEVRLLTLTGTGGIGKTRLALQVTSLARPSYAHGVCIVSLAVVRNPHQVMPTIAQALRLPDTNLHSPLEQVRTALQKKHALLVLDNFEQVATAAPSLLDLLSACPTLKILVTSRVLLRVSGEQSYAVTPLAVPDLTSPHEVDLLAHYAAVTLFVQRAQAIQADFQLTTTNAPTIAEICRRLDGLPLSIELAAARITFFPPPALLKRLQQRLQVLTGGPRNLPERQQTLRNTLTWSYDLLSAREQCLFQCLGIFVGGCQLAAVEAVCRSIGEEMTDLLDVITSLIDAHLVQQVASQEKEEPRLLMLETIREYALECLTLGGKRAAVEQAHATYYLELAQEAGTHLHRVEARVWLERLEREHNNLLVALEWLFDQKEMERAVRMSNDLAWFWVSYGHWRKGQALLRRGLDAGVYIAPSVRGRGLQMLAMFTINLGDSVLAEQLWQESLVLFEDLGDKRGCAWTLLSLSIVAEIKGAYVQARILLERTLFLFRELGDKAADPSPGGGPYPSNGVWIALAHLAGVVFKQGEYEGASILAQKSLAGNKSTGDADTINEALQLLALVALNQGAYDQAQSFLEEASAFVKQEGSQSDLLLLRQGQLAFFEGQMDKAIEFLQESILLCHEEANYEKAEALCTLGRILLRQGNGVVAKQLCEESVCLAIDKLTSVFCLEGLAEVIAAQGDHEQATRLWAATDHLRDAMSTPLPPVWQSLQKQAIAATQSSLGTTAFSRLWEQGRTLSLEQILADYKRLL